MLITTMPGMKSFTCTAQSSSQNIGVIHATTALTMFAARNTKQQSEYWCDSRNHCIDNVCCTQKKFRVQHCQA
jgi:hypothetical protein